MSQDWKRAVAARMRIVRALRAVDVAWEGEGRAIDGVRFLDGAELACWGRQQPKAWGAVDPLRAAAAIAGCGQVWVTVRGVSAYGATSIACNHGLCPPCMRRRALRKAERWTWPIAAMARQGYHVGQVTLTQRARYGDADAPVSLTERERAYFGGDRPASIGEVGLPVAGETLAAAWARWRAAHRRMMGNASTRGLWAPVVASVLGMEATQATPNASPAARRARWHVHGHILVLLDARTDPDAWGASLRSGWLRYADGELSAQDVRWRPADGVQRAIRETLKYPGKISSMTRAGVVEWLVTMRGLRPSVVGGILHGSTRTGRAVAGKRAEAELSADERRYLADWRNALESRLPDDGPAVVFAVAKDGSIGPLTVQRLREDVSWASGTQRVRVRGVWHDVDAAIVKEQAIEAFVAKRQMEEV